MVKGRLAGAGINGGAHRDSINDRPNVLIAQTV